MWLRLSSVWRRHLNTADPSQICAYILPIYPFTLHIDEILIAGMHCHSIYFLFKFIAIACYVSWPCRVLLMSEKFFGSQWSRQNRWLPHMSEKNHTGMLQYGSCRWLRFSDLQIIEFCKLFCLIWQTNFHINRWFYFATVCYRPWPQKMVLLRTSLPQTLAPKDGFT